MGHGTVKTSRLELSLISTEVSGCFHKYHNLSVYLEEFQSFFLIMLTSLNILLLRFPFRINDDFAEGCFLPNNIKATHNLLEKGPWDYDFKDSVLRVIIISF